MPGMNLVIEWSKKYPMASVRDVGVLGVLGVATGEITGETSDKSLGKVARESKDKRFGVFLRCTGVLGGCKGTSENGGFKLVLKLFAE